MGTKKGRHRRLGGSCPKLPPWIRHWSVFTIIS